MLAQEEIVCRRETRDFHTKKEVLGEERERAGKQNEGCLSLKFACFACQSES